jgi:hypothetical protein
MMLQMADHWMQTAQELERTGTSRCAPSRMRPSPVQRVADREELHSDSGSSCHNNR